MEKIEENLVTDAITAFVETCKLTIAIAYIAHWMACMFFWLSIQESVGDPLSWVVQNGLLDAPTSKQYIFSLYWAFTTMTTVGYGDISPGTVNEQMFVMVCMLIACGTFAYIVGAISSILNRSNTIVANFKEKTMHIN